VLDRRHGRLPARPVQASNAVVAWDPEELEDEDSDEDWQRCFKPEASSLIELMANWVDRSTFEDEHPSRSF